MSEIYSFVMCILLSKAYYYRMYEGGDSKLHINIVEEARTAFDVRRSRNTFLGEPTLNIIMSRYRKHNGCFVVVTQEPSSISSTPKANVYTIVALPMTHGPEIRSLQQSLLLDHRQLEFYMEMPIGTALVKHGGMKPFILSFPQFPDATYLPSDREITSETEAFLKPYTAESEKADVKFSKQADHKNESTGIQADSLKVLYTLSENPFLKYTQLQKECGFGVSRLNKASGWLVKDGFVEIEKIKASKGKPSKFLVLTDKAFNFLKLKKPRGKGSFKSKLYYHLIEAFLVKQGWKVSIEGRTVHSDKLIDVLAFRQDEGFVAYELTLNMDNVLLNIQKDILESKVNKVVIVCENKAKCKKTEQKIRESEPKPKMVRIEFQTIDSFFLKENHKPKGDENA
ncbi:hypothetical protein ACFL6B_05270 [Thermodesulfobacteriota bacterium]